MVCGTYSHRIYGFVRKTVAVIVHSKVGDSFVHTGFLKFLFLDGKTSTAKTRSPLSIWESQGRKKHSPMQHMFMPAIHASANALLGACLTAFMRKPGRVLFSPKAIMAILFPLSFSAARRASIRYKIQKSITSAVDDMIYIHEKTDPKTVLHVEREAERLATGMSSVKKSLPRRSGASPDGRRAAQTVPPGGEPFHVQIEREAERVDTPTDARSRATEPAPEPTPEAPNGLDSGRHSGAGRLSTGWKRLAAWGRSRILQARRQSRLGT